jgi:very-short-patch-repair endonuclease
MTDAERRLWSRLRKRQVLECQFRRQFQLGGYIVDFVCLERRLIVEVDGGQHAEQEDYDAARTDWLEEQDYRVLRFWNDAVLNETDAVIAAIAEALNADS